MSLLKSLPQLENVTGSQLKRWLLFGGTGLALLIVGYGLRAVSTPVAPEAALLANQAATLDGLPPIPLESLEQLETGTDATGLAITPELAVIPCEPLDNIGKACSRELPEGGQVISARLWTEQELEILEDGGTHADIKALQSQPSEPLSALVSGDESD